MNIVRFCALSALSLSFSLSGVLPERQAMAQTSGPNLTRFEVYSTGSSAGTTVRTAMPLNGVFRTAGLPNSMSLTQGDFIYELIQRIYPEAYRRHFVATVRDGRSTSSADTPAHFAISRDVRNGTRDRLREALARASGVPVSTLNSELSLARWYLVGRPDQSSFPQQLVFTEGFCKRGESVVRGSLDLGYAGSCPSGSTRYSAVAVLGVSFSTSDGRLTTRVLAAGMQVGDGVPTFTSSLSELGRRSSR